MAMNGLALSAAGNALANVPQDIAGLQLAQAKASMGQSQAEEEANKVQGGLAMSKSLAGNMAGQEPASDALGSFDNQIKAYQQSVQQMAQAGRGDQAQMAQQKMMDLTAQKKQFVLAQAAQASKLGNYGELVGLAPHMGITGVKSAEYDPKQDAVVFKDKDGGTIGGMPKKVLDRLDWTNQEHAANAWHEFMANSQIEKAQITTAGGIAKANIMANAKWNTPGELWKIARDINALDPNDPYKVDMSNPDVLKLLQKKEYIAPSMAGMMAKMMTGGAQAIGMTQESLDAYAKKALDTGEVPKMGFGPMGTISSIIIGNRAVELAKEQGRVADYALGAMTFGADKPSYQKATVQRDAVVAYEDTLKANYQNMLKQFAKIPETGSPMLNHTLRNMLDGKFGSDEVAAAKVAIQTLVPEIAKIQSGNVQGGVLSDHAQEAVKDSGFDIDHTFGQLKHIMTEVVFPDADNRKEGFDRVRQEIQTRLKSGQGTVEKPGEKPPVTTQPNRDADIKALRDAGATQDEIDAALGKKK
jgi:hypothetical protein